MTKHNSDYWKALETEESQTDRACNNPKICFVEVPLCNSITAEKGPATWKYDCWLWRQPPVIAYKCTVGQPTQLLRCTITSKMRAPSLQEPHSRSTAPRVHISSLFLQLFFYKLQDSPQFLISPQTYVKRTTPLGHWEKRNGQVLLNNDLTITLALAWLIIFQCYALVPHCQNTCQPRLFSLLNYLRFLPLRLHKMRSN